MRHLLSIEQLSKAEIEAILDRAESFAEVGRRDIKKVPTLRGRTVVTLFYESSTRTSSSFELAAKRLSADLVSIKAAGSSVDKGESLKDTVATLSAYEPAAIVIRHPHAGAAQLVAGWAEAAVVNAGDGKHEHPSQALLDVYTLRRRLGSLKGKRIWIVGDVLHSRVARSNLIAFQAMGAKVTVCGPPALIPRGLEELGCEVAYSLDRLGEADVVYALRLQRERMQESFVPSIREYAAHFQIDSRRLGPRQLLMHPGPVNRGVELSGEVIDSPQSLIAEQVRSGLVVRMAILYELLAAERGRAGAGRRQRRPSDPDRPAGMSQAQLEMRAGESADLVLRGATVLDPAAGIDAQHDVVIRDGKVAELAAPGGATAEDVETIEAAGLHAFPAFFDPHVHLRTPGQEHKEDIETGSRSAAAGGYCGVLAMANTEPPVSTPADVEALREDARPAASVRVGFLATVSCGMEGEELTEMASLRDAGAAGFSDDGLPVRSARLLRRALQYQRLCGGTIALHEEDPELSGAGVMHEGPVSAALGLEGIPSISESTMIARDAAIAGYEGGRIHVQHLSAIESVEAVRAAKAAGVQITCEASPHHLCLTDEEVRSLDPHRFKMNPPLRTEADRQALIEGLRDGTIDCIATDHAPHAPEEKEVPFEQAAMGVTGLETAFAALHTELVLPGVARPRPAGRADERGGAEPFEVERSSLAPGSEANVALCDLAAEWTVGEDGYESRSSNSWCAGRKLTGRVLMTLAGGQVAYRLRPSPWGWQRERGLPAARGRGPLRRRALRPSRAGHRRGRLQHRDDRLPGVGHRSLLRRPDHRLHLPADRQLRRLGRGDGVRPHPRPRRGHARPEERRGRRHRRGRLARLARRLRRAGDRRRRHARRRPPHPRPRRDARRDLSGRHPEAEARERVAAEPSMDGADLARTVTPPEPVRFEGDGPHVVGIDTGIKLNIVRQLRERGCR